MKRSKIFTIFIIVVILILIGVAIFFSQKRKNEFELVKSEANEILKIINRAAEEVEKAEKDQAEDYWYGIKFEMNKVFVFADRDQSKTFDKKDKDIIIEYNLQENIVLNPERTLFYLPNYNLVYFCDPNAECEKDAYHSVTISDITTGRAMEFRIEHKTGRIELREVVDLF